MSLTDQELQHFREWTTELWLARLGELYPDKVDDFRRVGLADYHTLSHLVEHSSIWPREAREYPREYARKACELPFFGRLEEVFGAYRISDYEGSNFEDFTWRLCRPKAENDVGPLHTDGSFWVLEKKQSPPGFVRVKCWLALHNEPGVSGLKVVPDSHKHPNPYRADTRHGRTKPTLWDAETPQAVLPHIEAGDSVLFHDNLLHGGAVGHGQATRVSLEFTLFVPAEGLAPFVTPGYPLEVDYQATATAS